MAFDRTGTKHSLKHRLLKTAGIAVAMGAGVILLVLAFVAPSKYAKVHDLPLTVAGNPSATTAFAHELSDTRPGVFAITEVADRAAAVDTLRSQDAYGAVVLGDGLPEVLVAGGNGPAATRPVVELANQLERQARQQAAAAGHDPLQVRIPITDVVPLAVNDPNGTALGVITFPFVLGGMALGSIVAMSVRTRPGTLVSLVTSSAVGGVGVAFATNVWLEVLPGGFGHLALAATTILLATATFIVGMGHVFGAVGTTAATALTMVVGNPLSGASLPWKFLAEPWGAFGQHLVPGAGTTLIRLTSYFPDAGTAQQWAILTSWIVAGLALIALPNIPDMLASRRNRSTRPSPATTRDHRVPA